MSEKWPAMRRAAPSAPAPAAATPCRCLWHARTWSIMRAWQARVCVCVPLLLCVCVCCICIDDNYMSTTATPVVVVDDADDYEAPAACRTICAKCRHCLCLSPAQCLLRLSNCLSIDLSLYRSIGSPAPAPLSPCTRRILISPLAAP